MQRLLTLPNAREASLLYKNKAENIELAEAELGAVITARDNWIKIEAGDGESFAKTCEFFDILNLIRAQNTGVSQSDFESILRKVKDGRGREMREVFENPAKIALKRRTVFAKNLSQRDYLKSIEKNDVVFGIGPAGTGKTYLAVAAALGALASGDVEKIILTRPAVEAGEALGFLPGDLQEKLQPYLRPL